MFNKHILHKTLWVVVYLTFCSCQSTRQSNVRSRTAGSGALAQGRTLGIARPLLGGLTRPLRLGLSALGGGGGLGGVGGALQSDPIYGGGYPSYGGGYGGYRGYGGYPIFGAFPGIFGGYSPFYYRPRPYYPPYGAYNPYAQRPSYASYGGGGLNSFSSSPTSSASTSGLGAAFGSSSTGAGSTASQAQIANQLGQALGASLRPLLASGGSGSAAGGDVDAGRLASLLGLLGG